MTFRFTMSAELHDGKPGMATLHVEVPGQEPVDILADVHEVHAEVGKLLARLDTVCAGTSTLDADIAAIPDVDGRVLRFVDELVHQAQALLYGIYSGIEHAITNPPGGDVEYVQRLVRDALAAAAEALETPAIADLRARVQRNKLHVVREDSP